MRYLSLAQVGEINERQGGGGLITADVGGVEAALGRAQATFDGRDLVEGVWAKAGVILHGLCSTQHFVDGNKRTAWLAAVLFLEANGVTVPYVSDVEAEGFTLAVATVHNYAEDRAAEWFAERCLHTRPGYAIDPRLEYIFLARSAEANDHGTVSILGAHLFSVVVPQLPWMGSLSLVTRIHWSEADMGREHTLSVAQAPEFSEEPFWVWEMPAPARGAHPHQADGRMPNLVPATFTAILRQEGPHEFVVSLDERHAATIPFNVVVEIALH